MTARFSLDHHYPFAPSRVWALVTDYRALAVCCEPYLKLRGLPQGSCYAGQDFDFELSLLGRLPWQSAHMAILARDDEAMAASACQTGEGIVFWRHDFAVAPEGEGAVLTETIEIEAARMTFLLGRAAHLLYRARHRRRLELMRTGGF